MAKSKEPKARAADGDTADDPGIKTRLVLMGGGGKASEEEREEAESANVEWVLKQMAPKRRRGRRPRSAACRSRGNPERVARREEESAV